MGRKIKVGNFEATLPAVHCLSVNEATRIMTATPEQQPYVISHIISSKLTYLQRKRFESLSLDEFGEVAKQWMGIGEKK